MASQEAFAYLARQYDRFETALAEVRGGGLPDNLRLIDASRVIDDVGPGVFHDIVHYDSPGRTTVGRYVADRLLEMFRERAARALKSGMRAWMRGLFAQAPRRVKAD